MRSFQYTVDRLGPHGLPLIGRADWNDCLYLNCFSEEPGESFQTTTNREGKVAESVFIAGLFVLAAHELADIADHLKRPDDAKHYRSEADRMEESVNAYGWDGNWFLRAYDAFGNKVGSHECEEGRVFIESNGMCVIAGIGLRDGRAEQALAAVNEHLATPHGIVLQQPAYSRYYVHLGEISSYPPGYKVNAGIFCHTNPWIVIAETLAGHADQAFDYYARINPSRREAISEVHRCEPYVYAQMIAGKDAATHGEAKNSWLTGTAAWNFAAITQYILGIQPTLNGLRIAPVIPTAWPGCSRRPDWSEVLELAGGGPLAALALARSGAADLGAELRRELAQLGGAGYDPWRLAEGWHKDRPAERLLWLEHWTALWLRQALAGGDAINNNRETGLPRPRPGMNIGPVFACLDRLREGRVAVEGPLNTQLLFEDLLVSLGEAFAAADGRQG